MKRLVFANQLRGVAALSVAAGHLVGVFWLLRDVVSTATFTPAQPGPNPPLTALATHPWFNLGAFGVGVFFLISGFVIPISLGEHSRANFVLARLLRIYPLYAAALMVEVAVLAGNAAYWNIPFTLTAWGVISNMLLIQDLVGQPYLDLVSWTLCVELRFYLVMALAAPLVRRGSVPLLFGLAVLACGLNLLVARGWFGPSVPDPALLSYTVGTEPLFGCFMLVGVLFNYHLRGLIGTPAFLGAVAGMTGLFTACWSVSVLAYQFPGVTQNYLCALALFAALYAARRWVPANPVLDGMAAISFPFYCIHSLVGYSVLRLLMLSLHIAYLPALAATLGIVAGIATILHFAVERPTNRLGKRLRRGVRRSAVALPVAGSRTA